MVTNVLGTEKDPESQAIQKIAGRKESCHGAHPEVSSLEKKFADVLLLRDVVAVVSAIFDQQTKGMLLYKSKHSV